MNDHLAVKRFDNTVDVAFEKQVCLNRECFCGRIFEVHFVVFAFEEFALFLHYFDSDISALVFFKAVQSKSQDKYSIAS